MTFFFSHSLPASACCYFERATRKEQEEPPNILLTRFHCFIAMLPEFTMSAPGAEFHTTHTNSLTLSRVAIWCACHGRSCIANCSCAVSNFPGILSHTPVDKERNSIKKFLQFSSQQQQQCLQHKIHKSHFRTLGACVCSGEILRAKKTFNYQNCCLRKLLSTNKLGREQQKKREKVGWPSDEPQSLILSRSFHLILFSSELKLSYIMHRTSQQSRTESFFHLKLWFFTLCWANERASGSKSKWLFYCHVW
jgi:hypothetical protein